ncbi:MAG: hypothetical protein ACOX1X_01595 [Dethiobacteria bacterium]
MQMELGQVVKSLAGRDKGKIYLIIGFIAGGRVLLVDGRVRTVNKPKKKNIKHLQPYRCVIPEVKERIRQGNLNDNAVRNALNILFPVENDECNSLCLRTSSSNG